MTHLGESPWQLPGWLHHVLTTTSMHHACPFPDRWSPTVEAWIQGPTFRTSAPIAPVPWGEVEIRLDSRGSPLFPAVFHPKDVAKANIDRIIQRNLSEVLHLFEDRHGGLPALLAALEHGLALREDLPVIVSENAAKEFYIRFRGDLWLLCPNDHLGGLLRGLPLPGSTWDVAARRLEEAPLRATPEGTQIPVLQQTGAGKEVLLASNQWWACDVRCVSEIAERVTRINLAVYAPWLLCVPPALVRHVPSLLDRTLQTQLVESAWVSRTLLKGRPVPPNPDIRRHGLGS